MTDPRDKRPGVPRDDENGADATKTAFGMRLGDLGLSESEDEPVSNKTMMGMRVSDILGQAGPARKGTPAPQAAPQKNETPKDELDNLADSWMDGVDAFLESITGQHAALDRATIEADKERDKKSTNPQASAPASSDAEAEPTRPVMAHAAQQSEDSGEPAMGAGILKRPKSKKRSGDQRGADDSMPTTSSHADSEPALFEELGGTKPDHSPLSQERASEPASEQNSLAAGGTLLSVNVAHADLANADTALLDDFEPLTSAKGNEEDTVDIPSDTDLFGADSSDTEGGMGSGDNAENSDPDDLLSSLNIPQSQTNDPDATVPLDADQLAAFTAALNAQSKAKQMAEEAARAEAEALRQAETMREQLASGRVDAMSREEAEAAGLPLGAVTDSDAERQNKNTANVPTIASGGPDETGSLARESKSSAPTTDALAKEAVDHAAAELAAQRELTQSPMPAGAEDATPLVTPEQQAELDKHTANAPVASSGPSPLALAVMVLVILAIAAFLLWKFVI